MPSWNELGSAWHIFRELNIDEIRTESEQPLTLACIGPAEMLETLTELLHRQDNPRYEATGDNPLQHIPLTQASNEQNLHQADMLLLAIDGRQPIDQLSIEAYKQLDALVLPLVIVVLHNDRLPETEPDQTLSLSTTTRIIAISDPQAADAADKLAVGLLGRMPAELHIAAARALPGMRHSLTRELVQTTSFSNAAYSLAAGIPEQIPLLTLPLMAADILVLTKNQALMTYKLALTHGAPADFRAHITEIVPVIGGGYLWRQVARSLVGLVPVWGLVPRVAVAYAGTYTTGMIAWRWYASKELVSQERLKQITEESVQYGRTLTLKLLEQAQERGMETQAYVKSLFDREGRTIRTSYTTTQLLPPSDRLRPPE